VSDATNCTASRTYTERELVLAQREAFKRGYDNRHVGEATTPWGSWPGIVEAAEMLYPLPKVTRPRVVRDNTLEWKYENGHFAYRYGGASDWHSTQYSEVPINRRRVEVLADLLANPTEEVESE
jgi:hypothetical protein